MKKLLEKAAHILWPEVCPFCGRSSKEGICPACREILVKLEMKEPRCMRCGKPILREEEEYCYDCAHTHHFYDRGVSVWLHKKPVSTSIYQFKYHNQRSFGHCYIKEAVRKYESLIREWNPEVIIPVPLHTKRRRKRGYNQAEILAEELGKQLKIPVAEELVVRRKNTTPQKQKNKKERRQSLSGTFAQRYRIGKIRSVLIIDDIYTTGSTVDEVSRILKRAGAEKVYYLTISIGQGY